MGKYKYIASTGNDTYYPIPTGKSPTPSSAVNPPVSFHADAPRFGVNYTPEGISS